jgi:hypothetical protein
VGNEYDEALRRAWGVYENADDQVAYGDRYNKLTEETANNDKVTQDEFERRSRPSVVGRTFTKYPPLPEPYYAEIPRAYPKISMPHGVKLDPYAGQAPGQDPTARYFVRPGTPESTARHEQVHVDTNTLGRPTDRNAAWFNELSPGARLQFRKVKALYDREHSHGARFADQPGGEDMTADKGQALANRRKELLAVVQELDRRKKLTGEDLPKYAKTRKDVEWMLHLNKSELTEVPNADFGNPEANKIAKRLRQAREGLALQERIERGARVPGTEVAVRMSQHVRELEAALAKSLDGTKKPRK